AEKTVVCFLVGPLTPHSGANASSARIRGSCGVEGRVHIIGPYVATHDSLRITHTSAEALGPIRNQASEPVTTAPLSAAMTRSSQDMLPILLLGVCETTASPEFDWTAGAIVSALAVVAAADGASLACTPFALADRSISLASFGEATCMASLSITSSFGV